MKFKTTGMWNEMQGLIINDENDVVMNDVWNGLDDLEMLEDDEPMLQSKRDELYES